MSRNLYRDEILEPLIDMATKTECESVVHLSILRIFHYQEVSLCREDLHAISRIEDLYKEYCL